MKQEALQNRNDNLLFFFEKRQQMLEYVTSVESHLKSIHNFKGYQKIQIGESKIVKLKDGAHEALEKAGVPRDKLYLKKARTMENIKRFLKKEGFIRVQTDAAEFLGSKGYTKKSTNPILVKIETKIDKN